jgi:hypothetical protein
MPVPEYPSPVCNRLKGIDRHIAITDVRHAVVYRRIECAATVWRKPLERRSIEKDRGTPKGALVSFAAIFFSEWGDVGQITAATMAARFGDPLLVWVGAVAAMVTKGALAASGSDSGSSRAFRRKWCATPVSARYWCWECFPYWRPLPRVTPELHL